MKSLSEIRGIIFDLGGVLLESFEFTFYRDAGKNLGISSAELAKASEKEWGRLEIGGETNNQFWRRVAEKLGLNLAASRILATSWLRHYRRDAKIKKDVLGLVRQLHHNYSLGIISNTQKEHITFNRKRRLFNDFDVAVLSSEAGFRKPQKEAFVLASKQMRIPFRHLLFIDDDQRWTKVARKYGLKAILFKSAHQLKKSLRKSGVSLP